MSSSIKINNQQMYSFAINNNEIDCESFEAKLGVK